MCLLLNYDVVYCLLLNYDVVYCLLLNYDVVYCLLLNYMCCIVDKYSKPYLVSPETLYWLCVRLSVCPSHSSVCAKNLNNRPANIALR